MTRQWRGGQRTPQNDDVIYEQPLISPPAGIGRDVKENSSDQNFTDKQRMGGLFYPRWNGWRQMKQEFDFTTNEKWDKYFYLIIVGGCVIIGQKSKSGFQ